MSQKKEELVVDRRREVCSNKYDRNRLKYGPIRICNGQVS